MKDWTRSSPWRWAVAATVVALLTLCRGALADPVLPQRTGVVTDAANILGADAAALATQLAAARQRSGIELVVVTLPSLQGDTIERWGIAIGNAWQIGGPAGKGAILIVAPNDRRIRIEVGDALSATLPDRAASSIVDDVILPKFRAGDMKRGVRDGVDALIAKAVPRPLTWTSENTTPSTTPIRKPPPPWLAFAVLVGLVAFLAVVACIIARRANQALEISGHPIRRAPRHSAGWVELDRLSGKRTEWIWLASGRNDNASVFGNSIGSTSSPSSGSSSGSSSGGSGSGGSSSSASHSGGGFSGGGASGRW